MDVEGLTYNYGTTRDWIREVLGELLGTFLLVFIGNCAIAQAVLSRNLYGNMLTINLAYGLAYMIGILVSGGASVKCFSDVIGGHINPAVTLAFALIGRVPCRKICTYFTGQYLGAFIAAFFTYAVYSDAIYNFDSGERQIIGDNATAGIFATFPRDDINKGVLFLDQMECSKEIEEKYKFIEISKQKSIKYINVRNEGKFSREDKFSQQLTIMGSFVLMVVVCAVTDRRNMEVHRSLYALYTGLTFAALGMSLGFNNDFPLNPARDFAPRIFLSVAGYGHAPFTYRFIYWIALLGPHIGAVLGALTYVFFVGIHLLDLEE